MGLQSQSVSITFYDNPTLSFDISVTIENQGDGPTDQ